MTELYALTRTAKENLETQIQNKTAETREKFISKENLDVYTTSTQSTTLTLTQADIDYMLDDEINLDKNIKHNIYLVIDRLIVKPEITTRLSESLEVIDNEYD